MSVSLIGPAGTDWRLLDLGIQLQAELGLPDPYASAGDRLRSVCLSVGGGEGGGETDCGPGRKERASQGFAPPDHERDF